MKNLIAVKSYEDMRVKGAHEAIRQSWGRLASVKNAEVQRRLLFDLRFFMGGGEKLADYPDEVFLNAPDDYNGLSVKVNEILRWAIARGYDNIVLVDTDTFVHVPRLADLPWGEFDYAGMLLSWSDVPPFMFGGVGFALSRDAAQIVVNNEIKNKLDDISIGKILLRRPQPDIRLLPVTWHRRIGWHFPKNTYAVGAYDPSFPWMDLMAQRHFGFYKKQHRWNVVIGGAIRETVLELCREDREEL